VLNLWSSGSQAGAVSPFFVCRLFLDRGKLHIPCLTATRVNEGNESLCCIDMPCQLPYKRMSLGNSLAVEATINWFGKTPLLITVPLKRGWNSAIDTWETMCSCHPTFPNFHGALLVPLTISQIFRSSKRMFRCSMWNI
jgi:hypothetical protein